MDEGKVMANTTTAGGACGAMTLQEGKDKSSKGSGPTGSDTSTDEQATGSQEVGEESSKPSEDKTEASQGENQEIDKGAESEKEKASSDTKQSCPSNESYDPETGGCIPG